jgi:Voltage-dependent anion channel
MERPPDVVAAVMATGVVSIAGRNHRYFEPSDIPDVLASVGLGVGCSSVDYHHRHLGGSDAMDTTADLLRLHRITRRPDTLRFTGAWWSLVFPLGMYSVATDAMAAEVGVRSMQTISLVFSGMLSQSGSLWRSAGCCV